MPKSTSTGQASVFCCTLRCPGSSCGSTSLSKSPLRCFDRSSSWRRSSKKQNEPLDGHQHRTFGGCILYISLYFYVVYYIIYIYILHYTTIQINITKKKKAVYLSRSFLPPVLHWALPVPRSMRLQVVQVPAKAKVKGGSVVGTCSIYVDFPKHLVVSNVSLYISAQIIYNISPT